MAKANQQRNYWRRVIVFIGIVSIGLLIWGVVFLVQEQLTMKQEIDDIDWNTKNLSSDMSDINNKVQNNSSSLSQLSRDVDSLMNLEENRL